MKTTVPKFALLLALIVSCNSQNINSSQAETDTIKGSQTDPLSRISKLPATNTTSEKSTEDSSQSGFTPLENLPRPTKEDSLREAEIFNGGLTTIIEKYKHETSMYSIENVNQDIERLKDAWSDCYSHSDMVVINKELRQKITSAKNTLANYQKKMFPKYRHIFAQAANGIASDGDMKVDAVDNYECIRFISVDLILESNRNGLYNKIEEVLKKYRYKRVVMTPYLGSEEGIISDVDSKDDTAELY
jgi:hypothetical protein